MTDVTLLEAIHAHLAAEYYQDLADRYPNPDSRVQVRVQRRLDQYDELCASFPKEVLSVVLKLLETCKFVDMNAHLTSAHTYCLRSYYSKHEKSEPTENRDRRLAIYDRLMSGSYNVPSVSGHPLDTDSVSG